MKLSDCLELSIAQKDKIEEMLTKFVSEKSPSEVARTLTRVIDSVIWGRGLEALYSRDPLFLENVKNGTDSYCYVLKSISILLVSDFGQENKEYDDVLPENDQSEILERLKERLEHLTKKED